MAKANHTEKFRTYSPPTLSVYGSVSAMTASGTINPGEQGNDKNKTKP